MKFFIYCFERNQFWKQSEFGYTSDIQEAGEFTYDRAITICENANKHSSTVQEAMVPANDFKF